MNRDSHTDIPSPLDYKSGPPAEVQAERVRIGVIGYGYWGPNLVRNFAEISGSTVVAVSDLDIDRLEQVRQRYPSIKVTRDYRDLLDDVAVDAVVIATPVHTHSELAMQALLAHKHVLIEKPIAEHSEDAVKLIRTATRLGRTLMVDHTFVYTGAVRKIKELVSNGQLGELYYYDSVRVNLGLVQQDVNVLWDLAVHDLSIMDFVLNEQPHAVLAAGAAHIPGKPVNIAYLTCFFKNNLIAHFHANWLAPVKIRRTLIGGARQMIVYDDLEPSEKIKVYDKGIILNTAGHPDPQYDLLVGYRAGDMWAPQVSLIEGLRTEALHFVDCIRTGASPLSDGAAGLRVMRILEAASESLARGSQPVTLNTDLDGREREMNVALEGGMRTRGF